MAIFIGVQYLALCTGTGFFVNAMKIKFLGIDFLHMKNIGRRTHITEKNNVKYFSKIFILQHQV